MRWKRVVGNGASRIDAGRRARAPAVGDPNMCDTFSRDI